MCSFLPVPEKMEMSFNDCASFFSKMPCAVILVDELNYIKYANQVAAEICGYSIEELIDSKCDIICPKGPRRCPILDDRIVKIDSDATAVKTKDGSKVPVLKSARIISIEDKLYVYEVYIDLTKVYIDRDNMVKAGKLLTASTLASGISHDFNNILMILKGNLDLLLSDNSFDSETFMFLNEIEKGIDRASVITNQMRMLSKARKGKKKRTFISELIRSSVHNRTINFEVSVNFDVSDDLWPLVVNSSSIDIAIGAIIDNSVQALGVDGEIQVTVINSNITEAMAKKHNVLCGEYVKITIQDNGIGIPPKFAEKIFEPFFSTKKGATGLGLSTASWIINDHRGIIIHEPENNLLSKDFHGTCFSIYLPVEILSKGLMPEEIELVSNKKSVLLMDDDEQVRLAIKRMLNRVDFDVAVAGEGQTAIDAYKIAFEKGCPFDLVFLDIVVPGGIGGLEAAKRIKKIDPDSKLIAISGYSQEDLEENYADHGFKAFLAKPFMLKELQTLLSSEAFI